MPKKREGKSKLPDAPRRVVGQIKEKVMYGYRCEYCEGTVRPKKVKQEAFKHKSGFIILEDVTIGVCDLCGSRYYSAGILHAVHDIATGAKPYERTEEIRVAHLSQ